MSLHWTTQVHHQMLQVPRARQEPFQRGVATERAIILLAPLGEFLPGRRYLFRMTIHLASRDGIEPAEELLNILM